LALAASSEYRGRVNSFNMDLPGCADEVDRICDDIFDKAGGNKLTSNVDRHKLRIECKNQATELVKTRIAKEVDDRHRADELVVPINVDTEADSEVGLAKDSMLIPGRERIDSAGENSGVVKMVRRDSVKRLRAASEDDGGGDAKDAGDISRLDDEAVLEKCYHLIEGIRCSIARERDSKIQFNKKDQAFVRASCIDLDREVARLLLRLKTVENECANLKTVAAQTETKMVILSTRVARERGAQVDRSTEDIGGDAPVVAKRVIKQVKPRENAAAVAPQSKSFAEAVRQIKSGPRRERHVTIVEVEGVSDAVGGKKKMAEVLNLDDLGGTLQRVAALPSGAMIIESRDESQKTKLESQLEGKAGFVVQRTRLRSPTIMFQGIDAGYDAATLRRELLVQNSKNWQDISQAEFDDGFEFISTRKSRIVGKENWIAKSTAAIFAKIMKASKCELDLESIGVHEYMPISRCYQCQQFGHFARECKNEVVCPRCGEAHKVGVCRTRELCCPNCSARGMKDSHHSASDASCPFNMVRMKRCRDRTAYDGEP